MTVLMISSGIKEIMMMLMACSGKFLKCRAENPRMPASQIEDSWNLDIDCELSMVIIMSCLFFDNIDNHHHHQDIIKIIKKLRYWPLGFLCVKIENFQDFLNKEKENEK